MFLPSLLREFTYCDGWPVKTWLWDMSLVSELQNVSELKVRILNCLKYYSTHMISKLFSLDRTQYFYKFLVVILNDGQSVCYKEPLLSKHIQYVSQDV